jgi:hypothetical protein
VNKPGWTLTKAIKADSAIDRGSAVIKLALAEGHRWGGCIQHPRPGGELSAAWAARRIRIPLIPAQPPLAVVQRSSQLIKTGDRDGFVDDIGFVRVKGEREAAHGGSKFGAHWSPRRSIRFTIVA